MKHPEFMQQKIMRRVLYALAPVAAVSVYYFGWRIAAMPPSRALSAWPLNGT